MIVRTLQEILGTERDVTGPTFASRRLLLAKDGMGFSLHETVLYEGTTTEMHYQHHVEAVFCIAGRAELTDLASGEVHEIVPGTLYALDDHDRHVLRVLEEFHSVCVFNPALVGPEVHDATGAYPPLGDVEGNTP
jgi:L-ectoine synthase